MKIGRITFHSSFNYGSMLQTYATRTLLEEWGHEAEVINFRSKIQKRKYGKPISLCSRSQIRSSIYRILFLPESIIPLTRKWHLFNKFMHANLNMGSEYDDSDKLKADSPSYDKIILGSDQIWNTNAFDFNDVYFGTFSPDVPKISLAASMGPEPETQNKTYIRQLLSGVKHISVREERTAGFLRNISPENEIEVVIDPTFLIEKEHYDKIISPEPLIKGDYIFYYTPGEARPEFLDLAMQLGKLYGMPVIYEDIYRRSVSRKYEGLKRHTATGPSEFLNLLKNARFVCGASFHLIAFSVIYQKEFYGFNGDIDSRMNNILNKLGLTERIVSVASPQYEQTPINYEPVNERLATLRGETFNFLKRSIESDEK